MAAYEYRALDVVGRPRRGVLTADSPRQVRAQLRFQGLHPLEVRSLDKSPGKRHGLRVARGIASADLALLTRQLATLVRAGMPLEESLHALEQQTGARRIKTVVAGVRSEIIEGASLSRALNRYPHIFPELYRVMVEAGEASGRLEEVLDRLADYTEQSRMLQQKFTLALIYPALVMSVAVMVVTALLVYVIPEVVRVFVESGQELPQLTRWLIAASDFIRGYGWAVVIIIVAGVAVSHHLLRSGQVRLRRDALLLDLPLAGQIARTLNAARLARTLAILTKSGTPLLEALRIGARVVKNQALRRVIDEAVVSVQEGGQLHLALGSCRWFPPLLIHMLAAGESSGELEDMLERAATQQEHELQTTVATLVSLFEPLVILVMGAVILVIVLAILMPIFEMNRLVSI